MCEVQTTACLQAVDSQVTEVASSHCVTSPSHSQATPTPLQHATGASAPSPSIPAYPGAGSTGDDSALDALHAKRTSSHGAATDSIDDAAGDTAGGASAGVVADATAAALSNTPVSALQERKLVAGPLTPETMPQATCRIVDFGNACWRSRHFTDDIQTRQYRSPEVICGQGYDTSTDLWSLACMIFELATGAQQLCQCRVEQLIVPCIAAGQFLCCHSLAARGHTSCQNVPCHPLCSPKPQRCRPAK